MREKETKLIIDGKLKCKDHKGFK